MKSPIGIQDFNRIIEDNFVYVDKVLYSLLFIILLGACSSSHRPVEELLEKA